MRALIRFNSTLAEQLANTRRHGIAFRWGEVIIPSREEVLKLPQKELYSPDLSYLDKGPLSSLSVRLAQRKFRPKDVTPLTEKRREQRLAREAKQAKLSPTTPDLLPKTPEFLPKTPESLPKTPKSLPKTPEEILALTEKRTDERLAREAKRGRVLNQTILAVQKNQDVLASVQSLFNSPGPLPLAQPSAKPSVDLRDHELSASALKRRQERRSRQSNPSPSRAFTNNKPRRTRENTASSDTQSIQVDMDDEAASLELQEPELTGPDPIPDDVFNDNFGAVHHGQHVIKVSPGYRLKPNSIHSLDKGDYSKYISISPASDSTSPDALRVVNTAEMALSFQPDFNIPQRKQAMELIKTLVVDTNLVPVAKEKQDTP